MGSVSLVTRGMISENYFDIIYPIVGKMYNVIEIRGIISNESVPKIVGIIYKISEINGVVTEIINITGMVEFVTITGIVEV